MGTRRNKDRMIEKEREWTNRAVGRVEDGMERCRLEGRSGTRDSGREGRSEERGDRRSSKRSEGVGEIERHVISGRSGSEAEVDLGKSWTSRRFSKSGRREGRERPGFSILDENFSTRAGTKWRARQESLFRLERRMEAGQR